METVWSDFMNSEWRDWKGSGRTGDQLGEEKWEHYFLNKWGLKANVPADEETLERLRDFRARLMGLSQKCVRGETLSGVDLEYLNRILDKGPVKRRVTEQAGIIGFESFPLREDWDQVMAEVADSFARTLVDGETERIRICDNPDCGWIFYDDTRNRTKKYCEDKTCGNLMKVRRFRARKRQEQRRKEEESD
ncbi:CGNR zinc finger domain-containing protein [Paenibacillus sp. DYY-L-2]|uniref:CGNR zinc finger domain-containing protein n=1 Tax=Paenibacillus sp. DYY-L-2 TaxID=3447013 RepID=UPI003F4F5BE4